MPIRLLGLHHVTATVDEAQPDLDFFAGLLALRLVKKTVNFDNHHVFHFYYGDERGTPGTIWTTFPYHGRNVRVGVKGAGQITATSFSVPASSLDDWRRHLQDAQVEVRDGAARFGEPSLVTADPSGLTVELVGTGDDPRAGWALGRRTGAEAIRGLHSVTMTIATPEPTVRFLGEVLGFDVVDETDGRIRLAVNGDGPGRRLEIRDGTGVPPAVNGLGTVHHVALAVSTADEQLELRRELLERGVKVTDVMDRQYFKSIYFREPGGVLLEVATIGPGFDVDEPLASLGQALKLPPWEEPHRAEIERELPTIAVP